MIFTAKESAEVMLKRRTDPGSNIPLRCLKYGSGYSYTSAFQAYICAVVQVGFLGTFASFNEHLKPYDYKASAAVKC